jgi:cell division protease FtsH
MADIDPKDWQGPIREAFHPQRYIRKVACDLLGPNVNEHRTFEKTIPSYRWPLWAVAMEDMTTAKDSKWVRAKIFGDEYPHREGPPGFTMVPVGVGKERTVFSEGCAVIQYGKDAHKGTFLLNTFRVPRAQVINVTAKEGQKGIAEEFFSDLGKWADKHNFFRKQKIDAGGRFLPLADVDEADLVLPEDIKRELFRNTKQMIEKWEDYARFGIPGKRGIIIAGSPGNGKSLSLKVLAKMLDCTFIWCTPRHVAEMDGFSEVYSFARELAPTVLLIEDADVFGLDRRLGRFNPILGELLNTLDGFEENKGVVTILTSNYAEILDSALTHRPGRFDTKIHIGAPGPVEAFEIIRRTLEKRKVVYAGDPGVLRSSAQELVKVGASGAYIVEAITYAQTLAVERGHVRGERLHLDAKDIQDSVGRVVAMLEIDQRTEKALIEQEGLLKWGNWPSGTVLKNSGGE